MSTARITERISVEDYLESELVSPVKHEYVAGEVFAMVGAKNAHNHIAVNALLALGSRLKGKLCRPCNSDTKIRVKYADHVRFYYPDVSVVCEANPLSDTFQDRPVLILEVLSESTRRLDNGEKRDAYFLIPTLNHYLLLEQDSATAVLYERISERFVRREFTSVNDVISLGFIDIQLPMRELYEGIVSA